MGTTKPLRILVIDKEQHIYYQDLIKTGHQIEFDDLSDYDMVLGQNVHRVLYGLKDWSIAKQLSERIKSVQKTKEVRPKKKNNSNGGLSKTDNI